MIACPSCERTWATEQTLASHLIDVHVLGCACTRLAIDPGKLAA